MSSGSAKSSSSVSSSSGSSNNCDGLPHDLFVSGLISGQMTEVTSGTYWFFSGTPDGYPNCRLEINIRCDGGTLFAEAVYSRIAPHDCDGAVSGNIISADPVLVTFEFPSGCDCPVGEVTVTE